MPSNAQSSVSVRDLCLRYGRTVAVDGVSFDAGAGEILGILGSNGAGKTTTLECILGLRVADSGSVRVLGEVAGRAGSHRRHFGALLQGASLQDAVTPRRAVGLFSSFYGPGQPTGALIDRFGLSSCADRPYAALSAGLRQRLMLALAFVNDPPVVVLDEPTTGLDPASRIELRSLVLESRRVGRAVLLSTHDLDEAERVCDRVAILESGRIAAQGKVGEIIAASGAGSSVEIETERPMASGELLGLPGATQARSSGRGWILASSEPAATASAAARLVEHLGRGLVSLRIARPSLEDAYFKLTGKPWAGEGGAAR
ncbi:MAG TPA: ABC transporter ATP-binding protein [Opitutaceae bacterium]|jgi:ABC-2 type transport system ATP-binding protein